MREADSTGAGRLVLDGWGRPRRPRLTVGLQYYTPYVSGLTEAARRLNEALVQRGWDVHVVTIRYDDGLARHAVEGGVSIRRCRRIFTAGKAAISPTFAPLLIREARQSDLTMLHLPLPEAGLVSLFTPKDRLLALYQCDAARLSVPGEAIVRRVLDESHRIALRRAGVVMASTEDYARHSRLSDVLVGRMHALPPPCIDRPAGKPAFRETDGPHIGFLGRVVPEKGLDILVAAFRRLEDPDARLLIAGDFDEVAGGSAIRQVSEAAEGDPRIRILGHVDEDRIADFYASLDVFSLPSIDSFEAFGIVQVEGLMAGVPAVVSDLPGVRQVAPALGAGFVVPPRQVEPLTAALEQATQVSLDRDTIRARALERYGIEAVTDQLEDLLWDALARRGVRRADPGARRAPKPTALRRDATTDPAVYDGLSSGWLFARRSEEVQTFLEPARPGDVVTEFGCRTASLLRHLAQALPDLRFQGVEPRESFASFAMERSEGIHLVRGELIDAPALDLDTADWILTNDVLGGHQDLDRLVDAVSATSHPWARWLAIEPNPGNPWVAWSQNDGRFEVRRFVNAAARAGWTVRARSRLFVVPQAAPQPPLALKLAERVLEGLPVVSGGIALVLSRQ